MAGKGWKTTGAELARQFVEKFPDSTVTEQTAGAWLNGRREPRAVNLERLNEVLGVRLGLDGTTTGPGKRVKERPAGYRPPDANDEQAWKAYLALAPHRRKVVREVIHALAGAVTTEM